MDMLERISEKSREKGLSQHALERMAGLPQGKLSKWKLSSAKPKLIEVQRVAGCLDVTVEYLLKGDDPNEARDEFGMKMIEAIVSELGIKEAVRRLTLARQEDSEPPIPDYGHRRAGNDPVTPPSEPRKKQPG